ncbi:hypothetical protein V8G54_027234 [Vigna mungo]|uniref:Uncharacterized protein n=1 Tax=Vigna mungo TaxID=3915 RepID=A0AAQ3N229_VIGMU
MWRGGRGPGSHVHRVTSEHSQEGGEFLNFCKRVLSPHFSHRSLKINVEQVLEVLCGSHVSVIDKPNGTVTVRPRLDLRQADVAKRKCGKHFEKHGGAFVMRENNARLERTVGAGDDRLSGQHHEARHVAWIVLDAVCHHVQAVELRRPRARDGGGVAEVVCGYELGGAGGIVYGLSRHVEAEFGERVLALRERLRMRDYAREELLANAGEGEEAVVDRELHLADDMEAVAKEEVVVAVDRASEGVFHR